MIDEELERTEDKQEEQGNEQRIKNEEVKDVDFASILGILQGLMSGSLSITGILKLMLSGLLGSLGL